MQIPIINGIYTDASADYRTAYPLNLVPVPKQNGIANGYLKKADGIRLHCDVGSGVDRGGINYNGVLLRVVGGSLYRIGEAGDYVNLGDIAGEGGCHFAYSFDRLAIVGGGNLYYWQNEALTQVSDTDLGTVLDVVWIDGYFITTDGSYIIQTELDDPTSISASKYGSSEIDPDNITGLIKLRNELCVLNRYTIEVFDNTGGANFAFQRVDGAMMTKGCVGTNAKCAFTQSFAFLGSGKNEPCSIYLAANGSVSKLATREIEQILAMYGETDLADVVLEAKEQDMHQHLYVHLPNHTLVYDYAASQVMEQPVWFALSSSSDGTGAYRGIHHVWCYNRWVVGDRVDSRIGVLDGSLASHYGEAVMWQITTTFVYAGGLSGQIKSVELVGLTGRTDTNNRPTVFLSHTKDGMSWSNERLHAQGMRGQFSQRIMWLRAVGIFRHMVGLRFRGCDDSLASFTAVELDMEALSGY